MNRLPLFVLPLSILILFCPLRIWAQGPPSIEVQVQSSFLVAQEETTLSVTFRNLPGAGWPESPVTSPLSLRQLRQTNRIFNRQASTIFTYAISGLRAGSYQVPPFRVGNVTSNTIQLTILPKERLTQNFIEVNGKRQAYYTATLVGNPRPYLGETQEIEAKIYIPESFRLEQMRFADFEKGDFVAWRFDPASNSSGQIRIAGVIHHSYAYRSSITALKEGLNSFGPGKCQPLINYRISRGGRLYWQRAQTEIVFPAIDLDIKTLPEPSPPGFAGAVGNFMLNSTSQATDVTVGDSVTVELAVTGTGNLDQLAAPKLLDDKGFFKEFDTAKKPQGNERRSSTGSVEFSQVIRPKKVTDRIPPYELVFFDPILTRYRTVTSPPIALTIKPSSSSNVATSSDSPNGPAFITPSSFVIPAQSKSLPIWLWQIIPALLALYFIQSCLFPKIKKQREETLIQKEFNADLKQVTEAQDRPEFFRRAAKLIDQWPANSDDPELQKIIKTRDEICFSPEESPSPLLPKERTAIRDLLQRLSPVVIFLLSLFPSETKAQDWKTVVIEQPTPEAFHNLGLVEKEAGNLNAAALYLYRHQAYRGGNDEELNLLLSQTGGYRLTKAFGMEQITLLPRSFYEQAGIVAAWACALMILALIARKKRWLWAFAPFAIFGATLWGIAWKHYPSDISFKPLTELSILMETTPLSNAPYDETEDGREIPITSVCYIHGIAGGWANVEFPGGARGWIPRQLMAPIQGRNVWIPPFGQKD